MNLAPLHPLVLLGADFGLGVLLYSAVSPLFGAVLVGAGGLVVVALLADLVGRSRGLFGRRQAV